MRSRPPSGDGLTSGVLSAERCEISHRLLLSGETQFGIALRDRLQPGVGRFPQVARCRPSRRRTRRRA